MTFHFLLLLKFAGAVLSVGLAGAAVRRQYLRVIAWVAVALTFAVMLGAGWIEWTEWKVVLPSDEVLGPLGGFLWLLAVFVQMVTKRPDTAAARRGA